MVLATIDESMVPEIREVALHKHTPLWEIPDHKHEGWRLVYVIQGEARYMINKEPLNLAEGNLLSIPPGNVCRGMVGPGQQIHYFTVDYDLKSIRGGDLVPPFPLHSQPGYHGELVRMLHDMAFAWQRQDPGCLIKTRGLFLQVLHRFIELLMFQAEQSTGDIRITRAVRHIGAHYAEPLTVKMLAEMTGLTPTYFGALFRQTMGISFNSYLIQLRVNKAESMLLSGSHKINSIAELCGFSDMSHFYKRFKAVKGYPPSHSRPKKF